MKRGYAKMNDKVECLIKAKLVLKRWSRMVMEYGHLDASCLNDDIRTLSKLIKSAWPREVVKAVRQCRDHVVMGKVVELIDAARKAEKILNDFIRMSQNEVSPLKSMSDNGMTERYMPLNRKLKKEKIRKAGNMELIYIDINGHNRKESKLARRVIEKRAAQTVHVLNKRFKKDNGFRQSVRRATSFCMYESDFIGYDRNERTSGTHWKEVFVTGKGVWKLKAKVSYASQEAANRAIDRYHNRYPWDIRPMSAYLCAHCGCWHIGHDRYAAELNNIG